MLNGTVGRPEGTGGGGGACSDGKLSSAMTTSAARLLQFTAKQHCQTRPV